MHQAMVMIIVDRIVSQYTTENSFCTNYLSVDKKRWEEWKKGSTQLSAEEMQKIKNLFSDYEWMLLQKIIRQTVLFPEKRNYIVSEYKRVKSMIAKKWMQSSEGIVELITHKDSFHTEKELYKETIILRVSVNYEEWGYDDILEFYLPGMIQQQIENDSVGLLEWVNENLTDTYVESEATNHKIIEDE